MCEVNLFSAVNASCWCVCLISLRFVFSSNALPIPFFWKAPAKPLIQSSALSSISKLGKCHSFLAVSCRCTCVLRSADPYLRCFSHQKNVKLNFCEDVILPVSNLCAIGHYWLRFHFWPHQLAGNARCNDVFFLFTCLFLHRVKLHWSDFALWLKETRK